MSRLAFISRPSWGHVDFGGRGFTRMACELARRGHEVHWLLLRPHDQSHAVTATATKQAFAAMMQPAGIAVGWLDCPLNLTRGVPSDTLETIVNQLGSFAACALDRTATFAGVAAHIGRVPWAAVGTNGKPWNRPRHFGAQPGRFHNPSVAAAYAGLRLDDFPDEARESCWLVSPYLNLSFMPRRFYAEGAGAVAHFVGADHRPDQVSRDVIVATLGASLSPVHQRHLAGLFQRVTAAIGGRWRMLGNEPAAPEARWQSYRESFADARLALGHGGNAFLWQAMHEGIPAISLPTDTGDQIYGAAATARLGMGRWHALETAASEWLVGAVTELLESDGARTSAQRLQAILSSGGGATAAASLIERLARDGTPAATCVDGPCCCTEPADA